MESELPHSESVLSVQCPEGVHPVGSENVGCTCELIENKEIDWREPCSKERVTKVNLSGTSGLR